MRVPSAWAPSSVSCLRSRNSLEKAFLSAVRCGRPSVHLCALQDSPRSPKDNERRISRIERSVSHLCRKAAFDFRVTTLVSSESKNHRKQLKAPPSIWHQCRREDPDRPMTVHEALKHCAAATSCKFQWRCCIMKEKRCEWEKIRVTNQFLDITCTAYCSAQPGESCQEGTSFWRAVRKSL